MAVILDNLELDEDIKKLRQLRAREQSAGIQVSSSCIAGWVESLVGAPGRWSVGNGVDTGQTVH